MCLQHKNKFYVKSCDDIGINICYAIQLSQDNNSLEKIHIGAVSAHTHIFVHYGRYIFLNINA